MEIPLNKMASGLDFFQGTVLFIRIEDVGELHPCLWIMNRNADVCICFSKKGDYGSYLLSEAGRRRLVWEVCERNVPLPSSNLNSR